MTDQLLLTLLEGGPYGAFIAFLIWDRLRADKINRERIDADLDMTKALTLLTAKFDNVR